MRATSCELRWTSHLLRDEAGGKSLALIVLIAGFSAGAWYSLEGIVYALIACAVLVAAMSRYFLPVHYCLTEREVIVTHAGMTRRMPWDRFRNFRVHPDGVFLSPFGRPSRLDSFRGCFLRFKDNRDEVLAIVRAGVQNRAV
ncbi:MAG: hypothetical protein EXS64_04090 [Candidatus Latescibacteria bacterium]|nr:hypothetical protein [Candidatus Latescibacterota bacterium]